MLGDIFLTDFTKINHHPKPQHLRDVFVELVLRIEKSQVQGKGPDKASSGTRSDQLEYQHVLKQEVHLQMYVSENSGTPKSSIFIGFSIINHPFWKHPNG